MDDLVSFAGLRVVEHEGMWLAVAFTQLDADGRLLDVEGRRPDRDEHEIGDGNAGLDQLDLGGRRVDEHPFPAFADEQLDGLGGCVDLEQLGVLGAPAAGPPAGQAFLRIEIEQRDALALLGSTHGKRAGNCRLAGSALGGGQRDHAQSLRLLGSHLVPTPLPGRGGLRGEAPSWYQL